MMRNVNINCDLFGCIFQTSVTLDTTTKSIMGLETEFVDGKVIITDDVDGKVLHTVTVADDEALSLVFNGITKYRPGDYME